MILRAIKKLTGRQLNLRHGIEQKNKAGEADEMSLEVDSKDEVMHI